MWPIFSSWFSKFDVSTHFSVLQFNLLYFPLAYFFLELLHCSFSSAQLQYGLVFGNLSVCLCTVETYQRHGQFFSSRPVGSFFN